MKLILDEGVPLGATASLRELGIESRHVLELGMGGASDQAILDRARLDGAVVVTLDADFHQILATTGANQPSVIRVRIEGLEKLALASLLRQVLEQTSEELRTGAMVSIGGGRIRVRRLPIQGGTL